ncbi:hypothetical protein NQZ68_020514 [Dissostichus eleginoides]|nr:hypothetical protein NQZ68_020514 [Dissostichus eleginoides]
MDWGRAGEIETPESSVPAPAGRGWGSGAGPGTITAVETEAEAQPGPRDSQRRHMGEGEGCVFWDVALALTSCPYDAGAKMAQVRRHLQSWAAGRCTVQDVTGANPPPLLTFLITKV